MNHRTFIPLASLVAIASVGWTSIARADDPIADALYRDGRQAAAAKDWALACKKFRESNDREPAPGTLLNLGDCEEKRAELVSALAHFQEAARRFRAGDERVAYATQRAVALDRRVPRLALRLHRDAPAGTTIVRDGVAVDVSALARPIALDPGEHVVVARARGRSESRVVVTLGESEVRELEVGVGPAVAESASRDRSHGGDTQPPSVGTPLTPAPAPPGGGPSAARTAGFVALGVGAVGLGAGLVGGVATFDAKQASDRECSGGCSPAGLAAQDRGKAWSAVGTAGFVTAAVGLASGAALLLFLPAKRVPQNAALAAAALSGRFVF